MKKIFMALAMAVLSVPSFAQISSGGFSLDEEHLYSLRVVSIIPRKVVRGVMTR